MKLLGKLLGRPDPDDFARVIADAIRKSGQSSQVEYDPENFRLLVDDECQLFLNNAYSEFIRAPRKERPAVIQRYAVIGTGLNAPSHASPQEALANLVPIVRERSFHGIHRLHFQVQGAKISEHPVSDLAEHLTVSLVVDSQSSMRRVILAEAIFE